MESLFLFNSKGVIIFKNGKKDISKILFFFLKMRCNKVRKGKLD